MPINKPYSLLQKAAKACGVEAPTPTSVRHVAETKSAKTLDPTKQALLSAHMSHMLAVARKYYQPRATELTGTVLASAGQQSASDGDS